MHLIIILIYLALTIIIGIASKKTVSTSKAFLGADLGILLCVVSGAGEWMGGTSTTGVSEYGYTYGISGAWYTIANGIGIIFLALFFSKLYRSLGKVTVSGIVGRYLGEKAKVISSVLLIFVMLIVGASQMVAAGTLGQTLFGMDPFYSILILGIGVILYTWIGGMIAVGYTNILHLITMYLGMIIAVIVSLNNIGGALTLETSLPSTYFDFSSIGCGKVFSWIVASVLGACTAQAGIQPILAAKDEKTASISSFLIALIVAPFGILTALLGMISKVMYPNLENAKLALPQLMISLDPIVGGLVLAAILAAILSTASPIFLASGTLFTKDIYQHIWKNVKEERLLSISKLSTLISGILCILIAIILYDNTALLDMVYFAYSIRGSIFVVLALGIYCRRISPNGAISGMIITLFISTVWITIKGTTGSYPIHPEFSETYAAVLSAFIFTILFSYLSGRKNEKDDH